MPLLPHPHARGGADGRFRRGRCGVGLGPASARENDIGKAVRRGVLHPRGMQPASSHHEAPFLVVRGAVALAAVGPLAADDGTGPGCGCGGRRWLRADGQGGLCRPRGALLARGSDGQWLPGQLPRKAAQRCDERCDRAGNLLSDGRPKLGLKELRCKCATRKALLRVSGRLQFATTMGFLHM